MSNQAMAIFASIVDHEERQATACELIVFEYLGLCLAERLSAPFPDVWEQLATLPHKVLETLVHPLGWETIAELVGNGLGCAPEIQFSPTLH